MIPDVRQCQMVGFPPAMWGMVAKEQEELKNRLREVRATQQDLADFMGISLKAVNRIANPHSPDGRKTLSTKEIEQIRSFLGLRQKPVYSIEDPAGRRGDPGAVTIPLFTGVTSRDGPVMSIGNTAQHGRVLAHPLQAGAREAFAVTVLDETMSPRFESGEIAYVLPGTPPRRGQDCLVESDDLTVRILQFVERREKSYVFRQLNPSREITRPAADVKVHAIVGRG